MTSVLMPFVIALSVAAAPAVYDADLVFPPEQLHNHSSSIVETAAGDLLVAWFHGRGEKTDDSLVILGARKRKGASDWSQPFQIADNQNLPDQNPVLYIDPGERLWLFWISSLANTRESYLLKYRISMDYAGDGPPVWEWNDVLHCRPQNLEEQVLSYFPTVPAKFGDAFHSESKYMDRLELAQEMARDKLWRQLGWMPRCQPIMLSEDKMIIGLYSDIFLCSVMAITDDAGKTWTFGEPVMGYGCIQPALAQRTDGTIVAYMRDKSPARRIRVSESKDGGITWGPVEDMDIHNPDSSVSVLVLESGNWILVCNDLPGRERHGRSRLTAYLSDDEGRTWKWRRCLEDHPDAPHASYPTVIQTADGMIHCTYTFTPKPNETIKHAWFSEAWVKEGTAE